VINNEINQKEGENLGNCKKIKTIFSQKILAQVLSINYALDPINVLTK
jgi:hypothetical protein